MPMTLDSASIPVSTGTSDNPYRSSHSGKTGNAILNIGIFNSPESVMRKRLLASRQNVSAMQILEADTQKLHQQFLKPLNKPRDLLIPNGQPTPNSNSLFFTDTEKEIIQKLPPAGIDYLQAKLWQEVHEKLKKSNKDPDDPAVFAEAYFEALTELSQNTGCKAVLNGGKTLEIVRNMQKCAQAAKKIDTDHQAQQALLATVSTIPPLSTTGIQTAIAGAKETQKAELEKLKSRVDDVNKALAELNALQKQAMNPEQTQQCIQALIDLRVRLHRLNAFMNAQVTQTRLEGAISPAAWQQLSTEATRLHEACNEITPDWMQEKEARAISNEYGNGWFQKDLSDAVFTEAELNAVHPLKYKTWDRAQNKEVTRYATDDKGEIIRLPLREHIAAMHLANDQLDRSNPGARRTCVKKNFFGGGATFDSYNASERKKFVEQFQARHKALEADKATHHTTKEENLPPKNAVDEQNLQRDPQPSTQPSSPTNAPVPAVPAGQQPQGVVSDAEKAAERTLLVEELVRIINKSTDPAARAEEIKNFFEAQYEKLNSEECQKVLEGYKDQSNVPPDKRINPEPAIVKALEAGTEKVRAAEAAASAAKTNATSAPTPLHQ